MNIYKSFSVISLIGLSLFLSTLNAQQSKENEKIEEIIVKGKVLYSDQVNALKTPVRILDVPQTLSIVTDVDIKNQGFRQLGDIVRYTPGVNTSQGEGHRDSVVFRGIRSTADFYLDGVRDDVQYYRSLYNLEQVEILRGPNALLFGRGGTGGMINRVTKKAVIGEESGLVDIGADTFGAFDIAADYNWQTGGNSALRVNVHVDSLDNHRDFYDGDRTGFNPTLRIKLSDQTTVDFSYEYADHERFIDRGIPTENGRPVESLEKITFGTSDTNFASLEAHILRANINHDFSVSRKGNLIIQSSDFDKRYKNLYVSGYDGMLVTLDGYDDPTERENLIISGNIVSEIEMYATTHTLLIGAEIIDTDNKNLRYDAYWSTTGNDKESFQVTKPLDISVNSAGVATAVDFVTKLKNKTESDIKVKSLFIQDQIDVSDNLKLLLGGRFDSFDITVTDIKGGSAESRKDEEFSPRAGIIYKPEDNVSFYFSYSESFLPRSGEQFKKLSSSSAKLDPDVFESAEIGVKYDISPQLSFTASYFESDQILATPDDTGEGAQIIGLQVDGLELQLKGQLNEKLFMALGYSNMDGQTQSVGEPREIPNSTFSLWAMYQVNDRFSWGLGMTSQGESNINDNKPGLILPDYSRIDFAVNYEVSEDLQFSLNVENLGDDLYFPHSHSTHQTSVGEGINARLSVRRRF